jgi:bifunctional non-homologous end joining protein LigD
MKLGEYRRKRNFKSTTEPAGNKRRRRRSRGLDKKSRKVSSPTGGRFVIQKHDATRLHYDLRLEVQGVLASWAIPKGLPCAKGQRHLAIHVEDHPMEYGGFEGTIPEGNYGAGTVMLWDHGTFESSEGSPAEGVRKGKLKFYLHGEKLRGEWTLIRLHGDERGKDPWLVIKSGVDSKPVSRTLEDRSVLSGKTMRQLSQSNNQWTSESESPRRISERE